MSETALPSPYVSDVTDASFERDAIERSMQVPVVVDFWAPWCGPCRVLGPLLERLAEEHAGTFELKKVNTDENPALASAFGVQSIPMVIGLRAGELAGHFVGALPESGVREVLSQLLPSEAEQLAAAAHELLAAGHTGEAEATFRRALELDPRAAVALVGLASLLATRDEADAALALLDRVDPGGLRPEADRLAASIRVRQSGAGDETGLRARVEANPGDLDARFTLAQLLAAAGRHEEALEHYLTIVKRDRAFREDGARKAMLDIFELLGPDSELADRCRSELAKALFR